MPIDNQAVIREIIAARAAAVHKGDVEAMLADVADNLTTFDVVGPLTQRGKASARKRAEEWLSSYVGSPTWQDRDVHIITGEAVAFSHSLSRVTGRLKTGSQVDMWFRTTLGFECRDGRWWIVHDHGSDPFDPKTGKALLGLKP